MKPVRQQIIKGLAGNSLLNVRMAGNKIFQLIDLIEDIKRVDHMIAVHQNDGESSVMLDQYQA